MQSRRGSKPSERAGRQRQLLISNYTSQRTNETQENILARDTLPSQQGKQKISGNAIAKYSQPVPNSQADFSDSDQDEVPTKTRRMHFNNSMRAFRSTIEDDSEGEVSDDVVYDSQEEKSDHRNRTDMNLDDVHSQMSFHPAYTSTQRGLQDNNVTNCAPVDRKRKKTSALSDRLTKKPLTSTTKKLFELPAPSDDVDKQLPSKRQKSNDFTKNDEYWELNENRSIASHEEPSTRRKSARASKSRETLQSQDVPYGSVDISQVSTGKSYDVEEPDSFLHHRNNRTSMFSQNDISKVVENMKDMIATMSVKRQDIPVERRVQKELNMSNVKKFRKAPQGRYNPTIRCSQNVIGEEDFKDFRTF